VKARGTRQRLAWFTAAPELDLHGGEIVLAGDEVIGRVTSAGHGYTCGRSIFCAYVASDAALAGELAIEAMGERHSARHHPRPPYDPDRRAILV
jgi:glycine cleavage system aminomethyltransferase T